MKNIKKVIRRRLHSLGYDLRRLAPGSNATYQVLKALEQFGIDLVLDVGANTGQFASELRSVGFKGDILSFEPLSDAHRVLQQAAARDSKWSVFRRGAIGEMDGEIEINVAGNSVSSSVLPMLETHATASPNSAYVGSEATPIFRLDSVASEYLSKCSRSFLKIDTQGFEWQVLEGAAGILPDLTGILCELSVVPLYGGQHLWTEIINRLSKDGFTLWALQQGFTDPRDGRTLQVDATFFRL